MKRRHLSLVLAALSLSLSSAYAQTKWDLPAAYAATNFHSENLVQFANDVDKATGGKLKITGDLTIKDVTKEVVLSADALSPETKDPWGFVRTGTRATTKVNRKDFGLTWNKALDGGGVVVGDDVEITLEVELMHKA